MSRRTRGLIAAVLLWPSLGGCYTARPIPASGTQPGMVVEVEVTETGSADLAGELGPGVERVSGVLAAAADTALVVRVARVTYASGSQSEWSGETLTISRPYVARIRERRLSRARSWLVVGATALALVVTAVGVSVVGGGSSDDGGGKLPPEDPPDR